MSIVGGHSIDDAEPKYGLAVVGFVHPDRIMTNARARAGDVLVLTKPLGMGIISTAVKRDAATPALVARAVELMSTLNRAAAEAMMEVGVDACTDITGYGLLGHLHGMTVGSKVGARLRKRDIPVLEETWDLAKQGLVPGGTRANREALEDAVLWDSRLTEEEQLVLCDAQTSGGLLMAVPPERVDRLLQALRRPGVPIAARIGEVVEDPSGRIRVEA